VAGKAQNGKRICVAKIGAAHGIRGDVKLWPMTADPMAFADYGTLESEDGKRTFEIVRAKPAGNFLIAHFKGVDDRNAAEKLVHIELFVSRDALPEIGEEGEFYYADLVGLKAVDRSGAQIGEIAAMHNFGAGDLVELKLASKRDTVLIPFNEETVPVIDIAGGVVTIDLPNEVEAEPNSDGAPKKLDQGGR
jgi:16S rRNA processing protein RimM